MTTTRLVFATLGALATGAAGCGGGDSGGPDSAPGADARSTADAAPQRALAIAGVDDLGRLPLPSAGVSGSSIAVHPDVAESRWVPSIAFGVDTNVSPNVHR